MVKRVMVWTVGALVLILGGCFAITDFEDLQTTRNEIFELPFMEEGEVPAYDILFVVDRPTWHDEEMWDTLDEAAAQSSTMSGPLGAVFLDGQTPPGMYEVELHIGVITSDLGAGFSGFEGCELNGDDGLLRTEVLPAAEYSQYNCQPLTDGDQFLRVVGGEVRNMVGVFDVGDAVQCMILAQMTRQTSCPIKQPFRAVQRAVDDHLNDDDEGFLRGAGGLAVVFISGEDDCSADDLSVYDPSLFGPYHCFTQGLECTQVGSVFTDCSEPTGGALMPTAELAALLGGAKGGGAVVVSVMAGPYQADVGVQVDDVPDLGMQIQPSCQAAGGGLAALPGIRLSLLQDQFADSSLFQEICAQDSGQFFEALAHMLAAQTAYRCMPKVPVDTDDSTPGMQAQCSILDVVNPGVVDLEERSDPYPECRNSGYDVTCWEMMPELSCTAGYKLVLARPSGEEIQTQNYLVEADCLVHMEDPR
jgi:hypothetical protein